MRWMILLGLLFGCSGAEPGSTEPTEPAGPDQPTEPTHPTEPPPTTQPAEERAQPTRTEGGATPGGVMRCRNPAMGMCSECPSGAECDTPEMRSGCEANPAAEFGTEPCTMEGAVGRCVRGDGIRVIIYGGPPRNHSAASAQPMCEMAWRGTYTDLTSS